MLRKEWASHCVHPSSMVKRKLYGVIGSPVAHSLSPLMHSRWFNDEGFPHLYKSFDVDQSQLASFIDAAKELDINGFNVTFPHKTMIMDYMDEVEETAMRLNAVNTVLRDDGRWIGRNTDGNGFISSLQSSFPGLLTQHELRVLVIGAGGAGRAISLALQAEPGVVLTVANRTEARTRHLVDTLSVKNTINGLDLSEAELGLSQYDLIINTTSAGFSSQAGELPLSLKSLSPHTVAVDIIYNPLETLFLKTAKENGNQTLNGLPMLIHQGALSFQHWHGIKPDTKKMEYFLTHKLEEHNADK